MWTKERSSETSLKLLWNIADKIDTLYWDIVGEVSLRTSVNMIAMSNFLAKRKQRYSEKSIILAIINYKFNYDVDMCHVLDVQYARQIQALFSKNADIDLGIDRSHVAFDKFVEANTHCRDVNRRLSYHRRKPKYVKPSIFSVLHGAEKRIKKVLGRVPSLETLQFMFGPGSNTSTQGTITNPRAKLGVPLACSHDLASEQSVLADLLAEVPNWMALHAHLETEDSFSVSVDVHPGKLVCVPKNAKTDRTIMVEPLLNSFFQKGIGSYMRSRLLHYADLNLQDQTRNQLLARAGSIDGHLATVDLSSASDTVSYELVAQLLPEDWFELLSSLRTGYIVAPQFFGSKQFEIEMFSTMGNAFTFELESLIFWALTREVCAHLHVSSQEVSVYGDDIICPTEVYPFLTEVLTYCGFIVNTDKSYSTGNFRESCGKDYLHGFDIRPFYVKSRISDRNLYSIHNFLVRNLEFELADFVKEFVNQAETLYGPDGYGDGHLIGNYTLRKNRKALRSGWDGGFFDTYSLKQRFYKKPLPGDAVLPSYSIYTGSGKHSATDPDVVRGSHGYTKLSIYTLRRGIFR